MAPVSCVMLVNGRMFGRETGLDPASFSIDEKRKLVGSI